MIEHLGERIKYEMAIRGISYEEMAVTLRFSRSTLFVRLRDPSTFSLKEIETVAKKLHIKPQDLLFGNVA